MEQKTEASQAVDERAEFEQWAKSHSINLTMTVDHVSYYYPQALATWGAWQARAALKAQPAPTEAASDRVPMPKNADQAELMQKLGLAWLQTNAPERLTDAECAAQGEDSARLDAELIKAREWIVKNRPALTLSRAKTIDEYMSLLDIIDRARASAETGGVKP